MRAFKREFQLPTELKRYTSFKNAKRMNWFESRRYKF